jgi:Spy/CpxP family protein refolding chaperone
MENNNHTGTHRRRWRWIVTLLAVVVFIWGLMWIWPGHRYDHHRRGGHHWVDLTESEMNKRMEHGAKWAFKKLDTTDEQEEVILDALKSLKPEILKLQEDRLELENRFREALEQEQIDESELSELTEDVQELVSQSLDQGMKAFVMIWETLTTEQREEVLEHWERKKG